jgi:ArsR family transcriptional regulator
MRLRNLWQTLNDTTRLRILSLLTAQELSVVELQHILHVGQSRISTHLSVLRNSALVTSRREGKHTYYARAKGSKGQEKQIVDAALLTLAEVAETKKDAEALELVLQKRREETQNYFNRIAGRLGKAPCPGRGWSAVGPLLAQLVPHVVIADLGAGEGWLSQLLAQRAKRVIAVDLSPKMVAFAKAELKKKKISNLEYRVGDLLNPPIEAASVDLAILSQALHHVTNPAEAIQAAGRLLKPGGRLIVLDLNRHQFDQARQLYGDHWLGFDETDVRTWLREAGFEEINVQLLTGDDATPTLQPLLATATKP